ncbi:hypothetical protein AJ80_09335 [Polytolypa hystricis UAMH7299]|uniref:Aminoglycoside phosphotransferase domain-containing protein n=1 Tax=Polytolypa hystricis (strain UAMH7299) TaxID=1447883 RepID=A0A2B7WSX7_POLH7|nr:hypothetical protein AJ80_09335 [Polytolypa hystricis UAMH7299]
MDTILSFILRHSHPLVQRWIVRFCPQTWLISVCRRARTQADLHVAPCVLRLSSQIAVHYGWGVWPSRAAMQDYAYHHVDPAIVRVPQVYRFFMDYTTGYSLPDGYLFMEYMPGKTVDKLDAATENNAVSKALTKRIADIVVHLHGIKVEDGVPPGPLGGGMPFGYLWGEEGTKTVFHSVSEMNSWLNKRLKLIDKSIDLSPCYPLVLCHGDLVRRNIIVIDDDRDEKATKAEDYKGRQLALVDWGHAAFLPRVCDIASMSCYLDKGGYLYTQELQQVTRKAIGGLTEVEEGCYKLLMSARALSLRYTRL